MSTALVVFSLGVSLSGMCGWIPHQAPSPIVRVSNGFSGRAMAFSRGLTSPARKQTSSHVFIHSIRHHQWIPSRCKQRHNHVHCTSSLLHPLRLDGSSLFFFGFFPRRDHPLPRTREYLLHLGIPGFDPSPDIDRMSSTD